MLNPIAQVGAENGYKYNGKELNEDFGLGLYDYGARWYDAAIGRWGQVDPLAEEYYSLSPFNYVTNNPLIFIDPDGQRIDVSRLLRNQDGSINRDGIWVLANIIGDLSTITGLSFKIEGGILVENTEKPVADGGSEKARGFVRHLLSNNGDISLFANDGDETKVLEDNKNISFNLNEIESNISRLIKANVNDPQTSGYGMTFLHEALHTSFGAAYYGKDPAYFNHNDEIINQNIPGLLVSKINEFRAQLGWAQRLQYVDYPFRKGIFDINNSIQFIEKNGEKKTAYWTNKVNPERLILLNHFVNNYSHLYPQSLR